MTRALVTGYLDDRCARPPRAASGRSRRGSAPRCAALDSMTADATRAMLHCVQVRFTEDELAILARVVEQRSHAEIADELAMPPETLFDHLRNVSEKLRLSGEIGRRVWRLEE